MTNPTVIMPMADYGHDPTETSVPYATFKKAGFEVHFVTENGKSPECDKILLEGLTQKLLGAKKEVIELYHTMTKSPEFQYPLSWSMPGFSIQDYDLVCLPGGHDKGVRQILDSPIMQSQLAEYLPKTAKPSHKNVAAICHGVIALAFSKDASGKSVLRDHVTTTLPASFERTAFWGTRMFLGDYYKTYGARSENCEEMVRKLLVDEKTQWKSSLAFSPYVVEDPKFNYISSRFPPDALLFSDKAVEMVKENMAA